jgi:hypothetical protein
MLSAAVTTEGDEVEVLGMVISDETLGQRIILSHVSARRGAPAFVKWSDLGHPFGMF